MTVRRVLKWVLASLVTATVALLATIAVLAAGTTLAGEEKTPAGYTRNFSVYVTMREGVRIAIDVWLPATTAATDRLPALIRGTRYGRAANFSRAYRALAALGYASRDANLTTDIRVLNERGYAVVRVDARGSGASYGSRPINWSAQEVADYGEIIDWVSAQPWSNGRVGAYGVSYDGNAAEMMAASGRPALKAIAPMYSYFDPYRDLIRPGGIFNAWFLDQWSRSTQSMDANRQCLRLSLRCWWTRILSDGIKPVDADRNGKLLAGALADRDNPSVYESLAHADFRDDEYGRTGLTVDQRSPYWLRKEIEASGVAINAWIGWYDSATADGALSRFATLANPQQLVITPYAHGGKHDTDPHEPPDRRVDPDLAAQYHMLADFFDLHLQAMPELAAAQSSIRYYTFGRRAWKTTTEWPPAGFRLQRFYLGDGGRLSASAPGAGTDADQYAVDFTASAGTRTRWHTIGGRDVVYADRRDADRSMLTYTSDPVAADMEVTGNPYVTLHLSASRPDCAIHAYLEEVAPDGSVTYLTEGLLRCVNRKESTGETPYSGYGPHHSFLRADALAMRPGVVEQLTIRLFAVSASIRQGHRIRIALAGRDASVFERIPADGGLVLFVHRNLSHASFVEIPVMD